MNRFRNRDYIPAQGEIPRNLPAVTSTPSAEDVTSPVDRQQARKEAQADRQRIKEEAERDLAVAMINRDIDNVRKALLVFCDWFLPWVLIVLILE